MLRKDQENALSYSYLQLFTALPSTMDTFTLHTTLKKKVNSHGDVDSWADVEQASISYIYKTD